MSTEVQATIDPALITWDEVIPGGAYWSRVITRGTTLRLVAPEGARGVALLCYNADNAIERYNAADTAKIQFNAFLKKGMLLYSDMGRVLFSITEDTCGLHDTLGGCSNLAANQKYRLRDPAGSGEGDPAGSGEGDPASSGEGDPASSGEGDYRNSRDNFLLALTKRNLGKKDIMPNLNLFTRIAVDPDGNLSWAEKTAQAGDFIDLRAEMNVLVVLSNCPHPLDPSPTYDAKPIRAIVWNSPAPPADDPIRIGSPEAVRGFQNTDAYLGQLV
ncbi:MAG: urea carboxylase-associated family protein [Stenomitos rutilans HA7619-LM2]|nr:urea carboxylase-associated family protein [Stenomitos rutilans HA7619-LM2]